jgi:hypothetical protein
MQPLAQNDANLRAQQTQNRSPCQQIAKYFRDSTVRAYILEQIVGKMGLDTLRNSTMQDTCPVSQEKVKILLLAVQVHADTLLDRALGRSKEATVAKALIGGFIAINLGAVVGLPASATLASYATYHLCDQFLSAYE